MKGREVNVKKIIKRFGILIMLGGVLFMTGCKTKIEKLMEDELNKKYGEDFIVRSYYSEGTVFRGECSPVAKEEVVFDVRIENDGTPDLDDDYENKYMAYLITDDIREDIERFFPNSFVYSRFSFNCLYPVEITDLKGKELGDLFETIDVGDIYLSVRIYYSDKEEGYNGMYEEEFEYFSNILEKWNDKNEEVGVVVSLYNVDKESLEKVKEIYNTTYNWEHGDSKCEDIFGNCQMGDCFIGGTNLGNPKQISACFYENAETNIRDDFDEYIRRRELLDNE